MNTYRVLVKEGYETVKAEAVRISNGGVVSFYNRLLGNKKGPGPEAEIEEIIYSDLVIAYAPGQWSLVIVDGADVTKPVERVA